MAYRHVWQPFVSSLRARATFPHLVLTCPSGLNMDYCLGLFGWPLCMIYVGR